MSGVSETNLKNKRKKDDDTESEDEMNTTDSFDNTRTHKNFTDKVAFLLRATQRVRTGNVQETILALQEEMMADKRRIAELEAANEVYKDWSSKFSKETYASMATKNMKDRSLTCHGEHHISAPAPAPTPVIVQVFPSQESMESVTNSNTTRQVLKNKVNAKNVNIKGIRSIKNNGVSVLCDTKEDAEKLKQKITHCPELKTIIPEKRKPVFSMFVPDVEEATENSELISTIRDKNKDVFTPLSEGEDDLLQVIHKHPGRFKGTVVFLQIPPKDYDRVKQAGRLNLSWDCAPLREQPPTKQCYKCQHFGHRFGICEYKIDDTAAYRCAKCSGNHDTKTCSSETHKCANCTDSNARAVAKKWKNWTVLNTSHRADSPECPCFKKAMNDASLHYDYGR